MLLASVGGAALLPHPAAGTVPAGASAPLALAPLTSLSLPEPPAAGPAAPTVLPRSEPVRIAIPALGVRSEVMDLGLDADGAMEVPPGAYPAGWYDRGPTPGELGPAVLAGHVDWAGEPGVFAGLAELAPGDAVTVERADGSTATFRVERVAEYAKDEFPGVAVYGDLDHAGLRLITCGGDFDDDEASYRDNVVVFARLAPG